MQSSKQPIQVMICGSGCDGSLLAWILARRNVDVILLDRGHHPRFAIGESSTPLADFLLEQISDRFALPELRPLARWGSWQGTYPELRCGKKRGFSYFGHEPESHFSEDEPHSRSLLVSASVNDQVSDTHWMRSDVDQWLCRQACAAGVRLFEDINIESIQRTEAGWQVSATRGSEGHTWEPLWLIDATGNTGLVAKAAGAVRQDDVLRTQTGSLFGHFVNVQPMTEWLQRSGIDTSQDPFDCDDAAQHHVLADGWVWMLRFACGTTSVGITRPTEIWRREGTFDRSLDQVWHDVIDRYPTLAELMAKSELIGPDQIIDGQPTPALGWMPRISRLWNEAAGERWLALPSTAGVIDPLHSTGLAHALSGVQRAAALLLEPLDSSSQQQLRKHYQHDVVDEVRWIDQLVSTCYAALPDFELFAAVCSFYFIAAIDCERDMRATGQMHYGFLGAKRSQWREMVRSAADRLARGESSQNSHSRTDFLGEIRQQIEPWNPAGLLQSQHRNRFARSAAPK